jgi:MscS family membrane protein
MLNKMVNAFIWVIGSITIIWNLWYNIWALITWAWVWGLAIALAAKTSIANIFWAISVFINKPFKIWDLITISGQTWTVKNIWLTYLTLIDKTWYKILIPNENIISSSVENISIRENRRTDFAIWVIYDTSLESLKSGVSIIENILEKYKKEETIKSYRVNFDSFWDFSLNINITYFSLLNEDYLEYIKQKEEINLEIKKMFEKEKIEMAFPTQEIILKK